MNVICHLWDHRFDPAPLGQWLDNGGVGSGLPIPAQYCVRCHRWINWAKGEK